MAIGLIMAFDTMRNAYFAHKSRQWPRAPFSVVDAQVSRSLGGEHSNPHYQIYFELEYQVHGKNYRTWDHQLNNEYVSTQQECEDYIARVRSGRLGTTVYYNPHDPRQSFTKGGINVVHILAIAVGLGITAVAYLTLVGKIVWK